MPLEAPTSISIVSFDDTRPRAEVGSAPRPAVPALEASARRFVDSGAAVPRRRDKIRWS